MTPDEFKAWRKAMNLSQAEVADALGLSKGTIENYERGYRLDNRSPIEIPHTVTLATEALSARGKRGDKPRHWMHIAVIKDGEELHHTTWSPSTWQNVVDQFEVMLQSFQEQYPDLNPWDCELTCYEVDGLATKNRVTPSAA